MIFWAATSLLNDPENMRNGHPHEPWAMMRNLPPHLVWAMPQWKCTELANSIAGRLHGMIRCGKAGSGSWGTRHHFRALLASEGAPGLRRGQGMQWDSQPTNQPTSASNALHNPPLLLTFHSMWGTLFSIGTTRICYVHLPLHFYSFAAIML